MLLFAEFRVVLLCMLIIKKKDILGSTQELDDTTIKAEAKYPINFTRLGKNLC